MKKIFALLLLCLNISIANAQIDSSSSKMLSKEETESYFNSAFKKKNLINFSIFRAYSYQDKSGTYYVALTESADSINTAKDTVNKSIRAINFKDDKVAPLKKWEVNDFKLAKSTNTEEETSIWFWTKYCSFNDIDGDGLVDPIIVYGTFGANGYDDGRAKIIVNYLGKKSVIRHQNNTFDTGRKTQVDANFYTLPTKLQNHVKEIMQKMIANKHATFPSGYLEKMSKKIVSITGS